jgi:hypothetical protein
MNNVHVIKSNKKFTFQLLRNQGVIIDVKTNDLHCFQSISAFKFKVKAEILEVLELYKKNNITLSTLIYLLMKNKAKINSLSSEKEETIKLLAQWAIESGSYKPMEFNCKI